MAATNYKRNLGIDILRLICAFMVVFIHFPCNYKIGSCFISICRIAVPIFFMITGFYYLKFEKKEQNNLIFKTFKLFIFANFIYILWDLTIALYTKKLVLTHYFEYFFEKYINQEKLLYLIFLNESPFSGHLWYLGAILYVLIIVKFLNLKRNNYILLILALLIIDLTFGKYSLLLFGQVFNYLYLRNFLFVGLPYFLIGVLLFKNTDRIHYKIRKIYFIVIVIVSLISTFLEKYFLTYLDLNSNLTRDHYISTTMLAISVFILFFFIKPSEKLLLLAKVGRKYSTNIYIIHPIIGKILDSIFMKITLYNMAIRPFCIFCISLLVLYVFNNCQSYILKANNTGSP